MSGGASTILPGKPRSNWPAWATSPWPRICTARARLPRTRKEAGRLAGELRGNPALLRARAQAALKALAQIPEVDPQRLAAIGFCFGGTTVLELAYTGAALKGVVSFHGGLTAPQPEELKSIKAAILVLHGADDFHVTGEAIAAFQEAMRKGGLDWQMVYFGGAVHGFMNPANGSDKASGVAYDARAARRSWPICRISSKRSLRLRSRIQRKSEQ